MRKTPFILSHSLQSSNPKTFLRTMTFYVWIPSKEPNGLKQWTKKFKIWSIENVSIWFRDLNLLVKVNKSLNQCGPYVANVNQMARSLDIKLISLFAETYNAPPRIIRSTKPLLPSLIGQPSACSLLSELSNSGSPRQLTSSLLSLKDNFPLQSIWNYLQVIRKPILIYRIWLWKLLRVCSCSWRKDTRRCSQGYRKGRIRLRSRWRFSFLSWCSIGSQSWRFQDSLSVWLNWPTSRT